MTPLPPPRSFRAPSPTPPPRRARRTGFHDNDVKSQAWRDIAHANVDAVLAAIAEDPCYAKMRAADGRGPLFWAHEFSLDALVDALVDAGADPEAKDAGGKTPKQMPKAPPLTFEVPEDEDEYDPFEDYVEVMGGDGALKADVGAHDEM